MADRDDEESSDGALPFDASLLDPSSGPFAEPFFLATVSWRLIACRRVLRPLALSAARAAFATAREWPQDRIEVAPTIL